MPPSLAHTVHHSVHGPPRPQQLLHVRCRKRPGPSPVRGRRRAQRRHRHRDRHRALLARRGHRMRRSAPALLLAALVLPAQAAAQTPPPAPAPPAPTLSLSVQDTFGGKRPAALSGRSFTVRLAMKPFVAGEKVTVRVYRGSKKIRVKALTPKSVAGGMAGVATLKVSSKVAGRLAIKASHKATATVPTLRAKTLRVSRGPRLRGSGVARPGRRTPPGQARRDALRGAAQRRLRRRHGPGDHGLAQGRGLLAHLHRHRGRLQRPAQGPRPVQGPPPRRRAPRRGPDQQPGPGADQRRQGGADLPHVHAARPRRRPSAASSAST